MKKIKKKILIPAVTVVLLGAGTFAYIKLNGDDKKVETVRYAVAEKSLIVNSIATTGKISSNLDIDIKCKASGEVLSVPFDISDEVKKGELLLKLNPVDEQQSVKQAEMTLVQSQAALAKAREDFILSSRNLENSIKRAQADLNSAIIRARELKAKAGSTKTLNVTGKQTALANLEAAKIKVADLRNKAEDNRALYSKGYISRTEYESSVVALQQAEIELKNAETRVREADTMNASDLATADSAASQAEIEVENARTRLKEQQDALLNLKVKEQDIRSLEARVESDKSSLQNSRQRLNDTVVYAPISGVITNRLVQEGQIITSGISSVTEGTTVLTISDLSRMFIMASVDESDIGKVKLGQEAEVTVDAFPGKRFRGKVEQIYTKGTNVSNVVTFTVKIEVFGKDKDMLKPEMTANVDIITARKNDVLAVPSEALLKKQKKYFVKMDNQEKVIEKEVEVGLSDGSNTEITKGLREGEKVILSSAGADNPWRNNNANNTRSTQRMQRSLMGGGRR